MMLFDGLRVGDLVIFANGDEAIVVKLCQYEESVDLYFNKKVLGSINTSYSWRYNYDGVWFGGGNNIVKVIHNDQDIR